MFLGDGEHAAGQDDVGVAGPGQLGRRRHGGQCGRVGQTGHDRAQDPLGGEVGIDDEDQHTKTRQVLRRLQVGQYVSYFAKGVYRCPFCTRRLGGTDFNCLLTHAENIGNTFPKVGTTVNVYSFRTKHRALGMHLRSLQRVEISAGRMPPLKPKAPKGSNKWRQRQMG